MRFDAGSVPGRPAGLLEPDRAIPGEMQDIALNRVRPLFATLPGVSCAAALRRQPAHDRGAVESRPAARVPHLAGRGDRRPSTGTRHPAVRQRAHRRPEPDRPDQRHRRQQHAGADGRAGPHGRGPDGVPARHRHDRERHRHRHRLRARQRPAHGLHPGDQARRRLDAGRHPTREGGTADDAQAPCPKTWISGSSSTSPATCASASRDSSPRACSGRC